MTLVDAARALVARTCGAQGIPEAVTDAGALARVAAVITARRDAAPGHHSGTDANNITTTTDPTGKEGAIRGPA